MSLLKHKTRIHEVALKRQSPVPEARAEGKVLMVVVVGGGGGGDDGSHSEASWERWPGGNGGPGPVG